MQVCRYRWVVETTGEPQISVAVTHPRPSGAAWAIRPPPGARHFLALANRGNLPRSTTSRNDMSHSRFARNVNSGFPHSRVVSTLLAASIFVVATVHAKVETWRQEGAGAFAKAHREGVVISDTGRVRLGHALAPLG